MAADPADELVDVVDRDDRFVGVVTRRRMRAERLRHRCVSIAVLDPAGRLLVHHRSDAKDIWAGYWDVALGGVVATGETYDAAAARELAEEVGVRSPLRLVGAGTYEDPVVALVARCYLVVSPGPFTFGDGEVVEVRWVTPAELAELAGWQPFCPDTWSMVLPMLGEHWAAVARRERV